MLSIDTAIELMLAPALTGASTVAARRWDERIGGVVSAFPAVVGPVLLVVALEHGTGFAARTATGTLLGLVALSAFVLVYAHAAQRRAWPAALAAGWAAAAVLAALVGGATVGPAVGLAAAAASLAAAYRCLPATTRHADRPVDQPDIRVRMALTALLVVALTAAAGAFGPVLGGVLAALPVL